MNNYEKKIMELITSGKLPTKPGRVYHIHCRHDPWCASNRGGECNCNVEVSVTNESTPSHTEDTYKAKKKPQYRGEKMKVFWR